MNVFFIIHIQVEFVDFIDQLQAPFIPRDVRLLCDNTWRHILSFRVHPVEGFSKLTWIGVSIGASCTPCFWKGSGPGKSNPSLQKVLKPPEKEEDEDVENIRGKEELKPSKISVKQKKITINTSIIFLSN